MLSLSQLLESARSEKIRDLIWSAEPQLRQVENMTMDEMVHEDKKVVLVDEDAIKDMILELSFTGVGKGSSPNPRSTDSTNSTNYSNTSLMDASMMTITSEDMSAHSTSYGHKPSPQRPTIGGNKDDGNVADAELLLWLNGNHMSGGW